MNIWIGILAAAAAGFVDRRHLVRAAVRQDVDGGAGVSPESAKDGMNMPLIFGTTFLLNLWMAFMRHPLVRHL